MGGGTAGKLSKQLKGKANDLHLWAEWCEFRAGEEWDAGNYLDAAKWEADAKASEAEADTLDAAAAAAKAAGL